MKLKLLSVLSTSYNGAKNLVAKVWNGKSDTRTAKEYGPFGTDSNPVKGMVAIYAKTEVDGREVIIGYLNKERLAASGEHRIFSTDSSGEFKFNIWLKADGTGLIGDSDDPSDYTNFAVLFNELKTEFNSVKTTLNNLINTYNGHTHATTCGAGAGTAAFPAAQGTANSANIDNAKNPKLKYNS